MNDLIFTTRRATIPDLMPLYDIGLETPEFQNLPGQDFMSTTTFLSAIDDASGFFQVAEASGRIIGFVYATTLSVECKPNAISARLVFITVVKDLRSRGVSRRLLEECFTWCRQRGVKSVHSWACAEGNGGVVPLLRRHDFHTGQRFIYTERKL